MDARPEPQTRAGNGVPNVVLVVLDDMGFADLGCYGSRISTPHIDRLADSGLRYNSFHVTALCSPTRACLLSGRNHHSVGMGSVADVSMRFPGYTGRIPKAAAMLPRVLRDSGYSTFAVGKWHLAPGSETGATGPFERWPLGVGFERYYGFIGWGTNQWSPRLTRDNSHLRPPDSPKRERHVTEDLASQAIGFVREQQDACPDKPFFLYFATGAMHSPHQVALPWVEPYRGRFDDGWEAMREEVFGRQQQFGIVPTGAELTARPRWVAAWNSLTSGQRRVYARMMEVYAGFLTHTDAQIGRLIDALREHGFLDNTLLIVLSDNGASADGGPHGWLDWPPARGVDSLVTHIDELGGHQAFTHYAWGWAWAGNTPFRLWKRFSWLGGVRVPLVVHWPASIATDSRGAVRTQFCHAIDVMPTILEATGARLPEVIDGTSQMPVEGRSFLGTIADADSPNPRNTQYFETLGSRAIYHAGWKAVTDHVAAVGVERDLIEGSHDFETDRWSLFHLDEDFSEARDLATEHPERLHRLIELWWSEAGRNQVLPLADHGTHIAAMAHHPAREQHVYLSGGEPMLTASPFRGFNLITEIEVSAEGDTFGVICAHHNCLPDRILLPGGWAMYAVDGRLVAAFATGDGRNRVVSEEVVLTGRHELGITCAPVGGDESSGLEVRLVLDGREVGCDAVPLAERELIMQREPLVGGELVFGRDPGIPLSDDYEPPFPFTGHIHRAVLTGYPPPQADGPEEIDPAHRLE